MPSDGDLIKAVGLPEIYVIEGGKRRLIPDMETFYDWDFAPGAVKAMRELDLNAIPLGDPLPHSKRFEFSQRDNVWALAGGWNHWMETKGYVTTRTGKIRVSSQAHAGTWLGGFHGGATLLFSDENDFYVGRSKTKRLGVDGTYGKNDTGPILWKDDEVDISLDIVQRTANVYVSHTWEPDSFISIIDKWVGEGKKVADLYNVISGKAKISEPIPATKKDPLVGEPPCMAGQPQFLPVGIGTIRGTVTSSVGVSKIVGAKVVAGSISTETDSAGNYILSNVPSGQMRVTASKDDYIEATQSASVTANQSVIINFKLRKIICKAAKPTDITDPVLIIAEDRLQACLAGRPTIAPRPEVKPR